MTRENRASDGLIGWLERLDANPGEVVGTRSALEDARAMVDALKNLYACHLTPCPVDHREKAREAIRLATGE